MFTRKTVFVVGAGASAELNLPVGTGLMRILAQKLHIGSKNGWQFDFGDRKIIAAFEALSQQRGIQDLNPYARAGRAIAAAMGTALSIDNFLDTHAGDEPIVTVGKIGIALSILEAERASLLYSNDDHIPLDRASASWLPAFFQMAHENVRLGDLDELFQNVSMVVFNYDRCIEHYLVEAVQRHFLVERAQAERVVDTLMMARPYGSVGPLPRAHSGGLGFGLDVHGSALTSIANGIRTFTEQIDEDDDEKVRTRHLLAEAEVVVYLGFSFNAMNMGYMSVRRDRPPRMFGTAYAISQANRGVIEVDVPVAFGFARPLHEKSRRLLPTPNLVDMKCRDFLDAYRLPIMRGQ